jgi:DNA-binding NtrC family response regulator
MLEVFRRIEAAAKGNGTVFLVGESGTGKELAARAVHECGDSPDRPHLVVNCAALPKDLIESELFGHTKGAYTGAQHAHQGLVRAAEGGTLLLDEITEMPIEVQAKLLRVLEEGSIRPVGTTLEQPVRVRFIASTNRDPEQAVRSGVLREDIYHRLNVHRIDMPPLRHRTEDIADLVDFFVERLVERRVGRATAIDERALDLLIGYPWPGNVRELRNTVESTLAAARGPVALRRDLPSYIARAQRSRNVANCGDELPTLAEVERALIERALRVTNGNKSHAAKRLGISRHRLYDKIRKFGIEIGRRSLRER